MDDYAGALDNLRLLAQRDLLAWWKRTEGVGFIKQRELLRDPFTAIVRVYGEQAAYAAADYLFLQRSLDDELRGLAYPEVADPVGFEQAHASFRSAMWVDDLGSASDRAKALSKLQGITNRLVAAPGRETVRLGVLRAGTRYARVPEPGACPFCLMLGARGAVYSKDSVFGEQGRYHDNCRCLGIEVRRDSDLPRINRELKVAWREATRGWGGQMGLPEWRHTLLARREQAGQTVEWPRLEFVRVPKYEGSGVSSVFPGEKLPPLDKMPGHVLHGWRDLSVGDRKRLTQGELVQGWPHDESLADGHRWDSERSKASKFPKSWTDQQIVDAVRGTLEAPDSYYSRPTGRVVWRDFGDVLLEVRYNVLPDGTITFNTAHPVERRHKRARSV